MTNNLKEERTLTAYEMQVLIGTTVSGGNMPPDRVFDLTAAWNRLHSLGLIDRADGLAIATASGEARVISALQSLSTQQPMGEVRVKALEWVEVTSPREDGPPEPIGEYFAETPFGSYYIDMYFGTDSYGWSANFEASDIDGSDSDSPEKAKAAAQADYERGIRAALHPNQESGE